MSKLRLSDKIKELLNNRKTHLNKQNTVSIVQYERECSDVHGFQLNYSDIDSRTKALINCGTYTETMIKNMIDYNNNIGYMSMETGEELIELFNNENCDLYIKTINSDDLDSIFEEGIRCLGNTSSGFNTVPKTINSISLNDSIQLMPELIPFFSIVKKAQGISQAMNPIDGTLIIQIPKDISKEELFYYNEKSNTFNIKPKFIKGFVKTNENRVVSDIQYSNVEKTI